MDSDQGKLFIGGISWGTTEEKLKDHFEAYGHVLQTVVMRDKTNGRPRGFGFVVFADPAILLRVLQDTHTIEGRTVEAKRALPREEQQQQKTPFRTGNNNISSSGSSGRYRTKKIFVGGLLPTLTEEGFRDYFEGYGSVSDVVIMYDQQTQRPRGFGFISFEKEDAVDKVLQKNFHDLNGKMVEVKRALPKDANPGVGRPGMAGGGNLGLAYDGRIISLNRYMQSQNPGGRGSAFLPNYGSSSGSYGGSNNNLYSGYGISYGGSPAGGPRASTWNSQGPGPSGGYGHVGYGVNGGGGVHVSANMGQSYYGIGGVVEMHGNYFGGSYGAQSANGLVPSGYYYPRWAGSTTVMNLMEGS
ncbi:heterogeneous nuclear ribonucleoprotein 1-like isoform X2 [Impatiens glandulifera]|uniref:heterogeneous nuclear ribonucleoprotein 1-like isoform X2 n=1 Tax=Impatiens glandulifera TaxID=253017 RepID=UPI001FB0B288|nr:heterogeneous nuclear ribonucleoprotein 1-like isoform X2 [Impatiens glandulifera]